eukprot:TRINITY_DN37055_c0_g1_i1.p1 TRINITY_DN37055_c0_g1~~TRINITY_DN37055_c0_g1_i1.p1  ORF type:complete len:397 (+),score=50.94 TRINITY_DN37055_c0_g1_i1:50-1240(+)
MTQVCVCGGGNAAHVMIQELTTSGCKVNLFAPFADEAEKFNSLLPKEGLKCDMIDGSSKYGQLQAVSKDPAAVIPGSKFIFVPLPCFAHEATLRAVVPHCDDDAVICAMPTTGAFDFIGTKVLKELGRESITLAGLSPLPYVCRIVDYAKQVRLFGKKERVHFATLPASRGAEVAAQLEPLLGLKLDIAPSFLVLTLTPTNPIMHTGRLYGLFGDTDWRTKKFEKNVLFYEECDDLSDRFLKELDAENQLIVQACEKVVPGCIGGKVLPLPDYLKSVYGKDITCWDSPKACYQSNCQFKGVGSPMKQLEDGTWVPDFKSRYFTEDFPFGLLTNKGIAQLLGVATPTMDKIILWAQKEMDCKWLAEDGTISCECTNARTPQALGVTVEDLKHLYTRK